MSRDCPWKSWNYICIQSECLPLRQMIYDIMIELAQQFSFQNGVHNVKRWKIFTSCFMFYLDMCLSWHIVYVSQSVASCTDINCLKVMKFRWVISWMKPPKFQMDLLWISLVVVVSFVFNRTQQWNNNRNSWKISISTLKHCCIQLVVTREAIRLIKLALYGPDR